MKFLLIYPSMELKNENIYSFEGYAPPLGILYLASSLKKEGHQVEVIDYTREKFISDKLKHKLSSLDAIGITILAKNYETSKYISNFIRKNKPKIPIIIGGPQCLIEPEETLKTTGADICVVGEGEDIITKIANKLEKNKDFDDLKNVYYQKKGVIKKGKQGNITDDLDKLPFPSRDLVEEYNYGNMLGIHLPKGRFTSIITSRGCPYNCRFCLSSKYDIKKYRVRSAENVVEEFKMINEKYDSVLIADDNFLANKKRATKIMNMILNEKIDLEFWIEGARVDSADKNLFKIMKKAGVKAVEFGIESGNNDVLSFYNKQITLGEIEKAVKLSQKTGFFTIGNFILGAPMETEEHFQNTFNFAKKLGLDLAFFYQLGYLKGCEIWDEAVEKNKFKPNEIEVQSGSEKGLSKLTEQEIQNWVQKAYKDYYFNAGYIGRMIARAIKRRDMRMLKVGFHLLFGKENIVKN